jgi:hypothetical protein
MKIRNIYLIGIVATAIIAFFTSFDVKPDASFINLFGYEVGANFTHNLWLKLFGFACLFMYLVNPTRKLDEKTR